MEAIGKFFAPMASVQYTLERGRGSAATAMAIGLALVLIAYCGGIWTGKLLTQQGFSMGIAHDRIPRSAVPTLDPPPYDESYERVNPHEPGSAP